MFAVIFEVSPEADGKDEYLKIAAEMRALLGDHPGLLSIERFQSLTDENKLLSLSFWDSEAAITKWRNVVEHRAAQGAGRSRLFKSYRIRVAQVVRDYTGDDRRQAPDDSRHAHDLGSL